MEWDWSTGRFCRAEAAAATTQQISCDLDPIPCLRREVGVSFRYLQETANCQHPILFDASGSKGTELRLIAADPVATLTALEVEFDRSIRLSALPVHLSRRAGCDAAQGAVLDALGDEQVRYLPIGDAPGVACLVVGAGQSQSHPVNTLAGEIASHYGAGGPAVLRGRALIVGGRPDAPTTLTERTAQDLAHMVMIEVRMRTSRVCSVPMVRSPRQ